MTLCDGRLVGGLLASPRGQFHILAVSVALPHMASHVATAGATVHGRRRRTRLACRFFCLVRIPSTDSNNALKRSKACGHGLEPNRLRQNNGSTPLQLFSKAMWAWHNDVHGICIGFASDLHRICIGFASDLRPVRRICVLSDVFSLGKTTKLTGFISPHFHLL